MWCMGVGVWRGVWEARDPLMEPHQERSEGGMVVKVEEEERERRKGGGVVVVEKEEETEVSGNGGVVGMSS